MRQKPPLGSPEDEPKAPSSLARYLPWEQTVTIFFYFFIDLIIWQDNWADLSNKWIVICLKTGGTMKLIKEVTR